jgi:hypothetical protein
MKNIENNKEQIAILVSRMIMMEDERNIFRDAYLKSPEAIIEADKLILKDLEEK